jgi:hypothetical protein
MSDPNAKITARRVDTDVAVIGVGPAGRALLGALKDPVTHEEGHPRS